MNDLQLDNLLHQADEAAPWPTVNSELATRVRTAARRRKNIRRATAAIAIPVIAIAGVFWLEHSRARQPQIVRTEPKVNIQEIRAELAQYQEQANQHMLVAEKLLQDERHAQERRRIERHASAPDALMVVEMQRDQAAQILMDRAERLRQHQGDIGQAASAYQRVIVLFPTTPAAQTARQRLDSLKA